MNKIKIGDIFEINTPKGKAYLHYIYVDEDKIELIRVLPGLYSERPNHLDKLASSPERYVIGFPLAPAYRKGIIERVGFYPADSFCKPRFMREPHGILGWHIVDTNTLYREFVEKLTLQQKTFSSWGVINDTMLIEWLVDDWSLDKKGRVCSNVASCLYVDYVSEFRIKLD